MGLRLLDTGTARDVSGVLRIGIGEDLDQEDTETALEGRELLYFVGGDGGVKVFERGQ
jgi:elongator complex protein 6